MNALRWTRTLLQAKAHTTGADWAHAYAELVKEKDALAKENEVLAKEKNVLVKEKDVLASVAKEKDAQLAVLTNEKDALAKQLSQCTALGNLTGARRTRLRGPLSPLGTFFLRSPLHVRCAQLQRRSMPQPRCRRGKLPQQVPSPRRDTRAL
jgi:hypothetical protein